MAMTNYPYETTFLQHLPGWLEFIILINLIKGLAIIPVKPFLPLLIVQAIQNHSYSPQCMHQQKFITISMEIKLV